MKLVNNTYMYMYMYYKVELNTLDIYMDKEHFN